MLNFGEFGVGDIVGVFFAGCEDLLDFSIGDAGDSGLEVGQEMLDRAGYFAFEIAIAGLPGPVGDNILEVAVCEQTLNLK